MNLYMTVNIVTRYSGVVVLALYALLVNPLFTLVLT